MFHGRLGYLTTWKSALGSHQKLAFSVKYDRSKDHLPGSMSRTCSHSLTDNSKDDERDTASDGLASTVSVVLGKHQLDLRSRARLPRLPV